MGQSQFPGFKYVDVGFVRWGQVRDGGQATYRVSYVNTLQADDALSTRRRRRKSSNLAQLAGATPRGRPTKGLGGSQELGEMATTVQGAGSHGT